MKDPENIRQDSEVKDLRRAKSPDATQEPPKLKAVLDGRRLPIELFGSGHARYIRKLVYNYIATWADPDGTEAYPGLETIARDCGLTVRGLRIVISWLEEHGLIRVDYKASKYRTNCYTVLFSEGDQARCRTALEGDEEEQRLLKKAEKTRDARSAAAKTRWAKQKVKSTNREHSIPDEQPQTGNAAFLQNEERFASDEERAAWQPGTECMQPGTQGSYNRPLDRTEVNRPSSPSTTPSKQNQDAHLADSSSEPSTIPSKQNQDLHQSDPSADDAVADVSLPSLNSAADGAKPAFDRDQFLLRVNRLLRERSLSTETNESHRDQACALAEQHGTEIFLAALGLWTRNHQQPVSSLDRRTWLLGSFLKSGAALDCIQQAEQGSDGPSDYITRAKQGSGGLTQRDPAEFDRFLDLVSAHSELVFTRRDQSVIRDVVDEYGADAVFGAWKLYLCDIGEDEFERKHAPGKFASDQGASKVRTYIKKKAEREDLMRRYEIASQKDNERVWAENEEILRRQAEEAASITDEL